MNESVLKTIGVAFAVCLVCSLIVSTSAVSLRDQQKENKLNDRRIKVLEVAGIKIQPDQTIAEQFSNLEQKFVDFDTGRLMDCLLYTSPSPRDKRQSRMPSSA